MFDNLYYFEELHINFSDECTPGIMYLLNTRGVFVIISLSNVIQGLW